MGAILRLGTRGSPLALAQTRAVATALAAAHGWTADAIEIVTMRTTGDRIQDRALADLGGKALWTRELDAALLEDRIDAGVHSLKDVETALAPGVVIGAICERADARDRLIGAASLAAIPPGGSVGTASPRRAAQLRHVRPDLTTPLLRGNVETRLAKVAAGEFDATLLAAAGLDRLGIAAGAPLEIADWLPAASQGAVGLTARSGDGGVLTLIAVIDHAESNACVTAERALLSALGASCHSAVGAHAAISCGEIWLRAESFDGGTRRAGEARGNGPALTAAIAALAARLLGLP